MEAINGSPADIPLVIATPILRGMDFNWAASTEIDHKEYRVKTQVDSDSWSAWESIQDTHYHRVMTAAGMAAHGSVPTVNIQVVDVDLFGQQSVNPTVGTGTPDTLNSIDMSGAIFQIIATDSLSTTDLTSLFDGVTTTGGILY